MDYKNQPQGGPADAGAQQGQTAEANGGYQQVQPQAGAFYQFQPGVGFVQVQGPAQTTGQQGADTAQPGQDSHGTRAAQGMGAQTASSQATADATSGMYGQGIPDGAEAKFDQNKLGQMYGAVSDMMNGDGDPSKLLGLLSTSGGEFWKGALVGAAAAVLLNNDAVKGAIAGVFGSFMGSKDPEGEQVTVKK